MMYHRYTDVHKRNNLIWVWNSPVPECYLGDDVVDIISRDMYPPAHEYTAQSRMYHQLIGITQQSKIALIGETGTLPSAKAIAEERIGWASDMTWSHELCIGEDYTTNAALNEMYHSPYAVTKDTLPQLY